MCKLLLELYINILISDMVTKMLQLEQIFKKYEVEEDECRAYIACEAANVERLAENGPIVQQAHELFSSITYVLNLLQNREIKLPQNHFSVIWL